MQVFKFSIVLLCTASLAGCVFSTKSSSPAVSNVEKNAELAVQQCGQGNVQEVTDKGFSCRK